MSPHIIGSRLVQSYYRNQQEKMEKMEKMFLTSHLAAVKAIWRNLVSGDA